MKQTLVCELFMTHPCLDLPPMQTGMRNRGCSGPTSTPETTKGINLTKGKDRNRRVKHELPLKSISKKAFSSTNNPKLNQTVSFTRNLQK